MSIIFYLATFIYSTRCWCNFYIVIEYAQPERKDEELRLLGTAVNGEILISIFGEIHTIMSKNALINLKSHQELQNSIYYEISICTNRPTQR